MSPPQNPHNPRYRRGRAVLVGVVLLEGLAAGHLALDHRIVELSFGDLLAERGSTGRVIRVAARARPDVGRSDLGAEDGWVVPLVAPRTASATPAVAGVFPRGAASERVVSTATAPVELVLVGRVTPERREDVGRRMAKAGVPPPRVVLEVAPEEAADAPFAPLLLLALATFAAVKGWPGLRDLEGERRILAHRSELRQALEFAFLGAALGGALVADGYVRRAGVELVWLLPVAAALLMAGALLLAGRACRWIGIGR